MNNKRYSKLRWWLFAFKGVWAVLAALTVGAFLIILAGANPLDAYVALFNGALFDYYGLASSLVRLCPILLVSLAVIVPLRAGFFNIGGEGQVYIGALCSTLAALYLPTVLPGSIRIVFVILAGGFGGALWALIPAALKVYRGTNEIISSLLLSYVAIYLVGAIIQVYLMEPGAPYPYTREIPSEVTLPLFLPQTEAHIGVIFAVAIALLVSVVLNRTTFGLSIETVGHNPDAAAYAGISIRRTAIIAFLVGGSMAGLAGTFEVIGVKYRLFDHFSPGYGFQGVIVAFLANLDPRLAILAALFLAVLQAGAGSMQRAVGVDTMMVGALQGLVVLFVAVGLSIRYRATFAIQTQPVSTASTSATEREQ
ncbi:MAG: ABC transporter permease [Rhizobiaceae bacterium]|nr:ABC transporter permease [Bellilinea sp.]